MEDIFGKVFAKESNFEILGKEQQILQILLAPQQKIMTRASSILYMSSNIKTKSNIDIKTLGIFNRIYKMIHRNVTNEDLKFEIVNDSIGIGYAGLSKNAGKVLALNPIIFSNICVREKNILAYSQQIEINWQFKPTFKSLQNNVWAKIRNFKLEKDALLFLQSDTTVIEKELGIGEVIVVKDECLIAFTNSLNFTTCKSAFKNADAKGLNMIEIKGPGTIFIEKENPLLKTNSLKNYKMIEIFLIIMILNAVISFTEFMSFHMARNDE